MIYDLTKEDFDKISVAMTKATQVTNNSLQLTALIPPLSIELSIGLINLRDIRSVIKQNPPKPVKKNEGTAPDLTPEEIEWMVANKSAWREGDDLQ